MDKRNLEKKIADWATDLGFCLPDGSIPPPGFFASLTATPHRRQLWEVLVESIKSRKEVEYVRKQLLVNQLKERKNSSGRGKTKKINNKLELWDKQKELETEIEKEKKACADLEQNISSKSSDLMFETCKLGELEKELNELKNEAFALSLLNSKANRIIKNFDKALEISTSVKDSKNASSKDLHSVNLQEEVQKLAQEIADGDICNLDTLNSDHECEILNKLKAIRESGVTEVDLWNETLKQKKKVFDQLLNGLHSLKNLEKDLREKEEAVNADLKNSVVKMKKEILEKAMQVMINETEGKLLDRDIEKLMENMEMLILTNPLERNASLQHITKEEIDESFSFKHKLLSQLRDHVNEVGKRSRNECLKQELSKIELKVAKAREECSGQTNSEKKLEETLKSIESNINEMWELKSRSEEHDKVIRKLIEDRQEVMVSSPERIGLGETVENLKGGVLRMADLLHEVPLDTLKNTECHSETSSNLPASSCADYDFATLTLPGQSKESIGREMEKRKKMNEDMEKFISEREKLSDFQKKIYSRLSSINYDEKFCEKNSKESEEILRAVQFKADSLTEGIGSLEGVLKNWLEQPYQHMINDSEEVNRKTFKEYKKLHAV